jgi:hypothetical protein
VSTLQVRAGFPAGRRCPAYPAPRHLVAPQPNAGASCTLAAPAFRCEMSRSYWGASCGARRASSWRPAGPWLGLRPARPRSSPRQGVWSLRPPTGGQGDALGAPSPGPVPQAWPRSSRGPQRAEARSPQGLQRGGNPLVPTAYPPVNRKSELSPGPANGGPPSPSGEPLGRHPILTRPPAGQPPVAASLSNPRANRDFFKRRPPGPAIHRSPAAALRLQGPPSGALHPLDDRGATQRSRVALRGAAEWHSRHGWLQCEIQ